MQKTGFLFTSLFLFGIVFSVTAQDKHVLLWETRQVVDPVSGEQFLVPASKDAVLDEQLVPKAQLQLEGAISAFKLEQIESAEVPSGSVQVWAEAKLPETFEVEIVQVSERGKIISLIYITAVRRLPASGITEKLLSFSYSYETGPQPLQAPVRKKNSAGSNFKISALNSSVLSAGIWHKICVSGSGIYKIDHQYLTSIGIDPASTDPRQIRIFGNGGGMLPQALSESRFDDLEENNIYVSGEDDGKFDPGDYILFFAQGPDTWEYNSTGKIYTHTKNLYSDLSCYFITVGPSNGLRVQEKTIVTGATQTLTSFEDHVFKEDELESILHSGRIWFGDKFIYTLNNEYGFSFPGLLPDSEVIINTSVMSASNATTRFYLDVNHVKADTIRFTGISNIYDYAYSTKGQILTSLTKINSSKWSNSEYLTLSLSYNQGGNSLATGYLDFFEITAKRDLRLYGSQTMFRNSQSLNAAISEYSIGNAGANMQVWDITNPVHPEQVRHTLDNGRLIFTDSSISLKEYVVFSGTSFPAPTHAGRVNNQDLHSIGNSDVPDLVIVTSPSLLSAANRLAEHRRNFSGLDVEVVTTDQVYNEFSSGVQDISAIRDLAKMVYDRSSDSDPFRYLLLFGDCSYDYKNRISNNTNLVPVYEARNSLSPTQTFSSDDYFGFLDNSEGQWYESQSGNHRMEIGVGRLPVKNLGEANTVVDKLINYDKSLTAMGKWRNRITFVADDGDSNAHQSHADSLANKVNQLHPVYNVNKIYLDAFPQVPGPGGEIAAEANDQLSRQVEKGVLIVNYTGHGGETGWTQEKVLEVSDINSWENYDRLTFMITATCEFGRYDDPGRPSGAEFALLSNKGAAVGLMTTTRPVFSNSNFDINNALYSYIFTAVDGEMPALGEVMRQTKNDYKSLASGVNNRNYSLLGDPSQILAYPKEEVVLTRLNGKDISAGTDTLKALGKVTLEGEVRAGGMLKSDFNGSVNVTVYDKESIVETLGNETNSGTMFFRHLNNYIYDGLAPVTDGKFSITFIVPKDINYKFDPGKISLYARKATQLEDAHGYNSEIIIGGSEENVEEDNTPPQINLYMNDESFVFGGLTGENSLLLVKLSDENGINISGAGIGHEIAAYLDNSQEPIILNEFYTASLEGYEKGTVEYPLKDLSPGVHTIRVKAWDTHNNSNEAILEFVVANEEEIEINNVLNYPNPFSSNTTFQFNHNRAGDDLQVLVQIFSVSGKLVKTISSDFLMSDSHISGIQWDGRDDFGDRIGRGVYVYKVEVRSLRDGSKSHKYQKLVILN